MLLLTVYLNRYVIYGEGPTVTFSFILIFFFGQATCSFFPILRVVFKTDLAKGNIFLMLHYYLSAQVHNHLLGLAETYSLLVFLLQSQQIQCKD